MSADAAEMTAAAWLAREDRGLTAAEREARDLWLEQSSLNKVAYLRLKAAWRRADRLAALKRPVPAIRPALVIHEGRFSRLGVKLAIAASLTLLLGAGAFLALRPAPPAKVQDYATGIGGMRALRLADGTQVELNTNTRLQAGDRTVTLKSGEAYFDVVHDAGRPFTVYAGNRRITDIGTRFAVFRNGDDVRVTVREGKVRVESLDGQGQDAVLVPAGREVIAAGSESLMLQKPARDIDNGLAWRGGMLVFDQQPLGEVAEQFNRYNARHIQVESGASRIRIGGRFKARNVESFVQLLHRGFGLTVREEGDRILVSR